MALRKEHRVGLGVFVLLGVAAFMWLVVVPVASADPDYWRWEWPQTDFT